MRLPWALVTPPAPAGTLTFSPSDWDIQVGDDLTIIVGIDGANTATGGGILGFGFDTDLTPAGILSLTGVTVKPLFDEVSSLLPNTDVAGMAFPAITDAEFNLAVLSLKAIATGIGTLGVISDLDNPNQGLIYSSADAEDISGEMHIRVHAPAPETSFLIGLGFIALAF